MAVDLFCCRAHLGHFLQTFKNCFEISIYFKGNFELVLPIMESHKIILFRHVYPNCFMVCTIFEVLAPGCLAVKSLKAVQAEVLSGSIAAIATSK